MHAALLRALNPNIPLRPRWMQVPRIRKVPGEFGVLLQPLPAMMTRRPDGLEPRFGANHILRL